MNGYRLRRANARFAWLLAALISLAACQGGASVSTPVVTGASQPAPVVVTGGPLTLTIISPANEAVVNVPQVDVLGQAPAQAVVTINDNVVVVGATGEFSTTVPLQDGPNEIEVLASDPEGNQASTRLIVTFEAPG